MTQDTIFKMYHTDDDGVRRLYHLCMPCTVLIVLNKKGVKHKIIRGNVPGCDYCNCNLRMNFGGSDD